MARSGWRLAEHELREWLTELLGAERTVVAPVERDGLRIFRPVADASEVELGSGKTRWSPKEFLFPRTEALYRYRLGAAGPVLEDPAPVEGELVLFGVRSCDAAGLVRLDRVFDAGAVRDPFYVARRAATTVVACACRSAGPECFCTAVGGSPMGTEGVDLLLVPFEDDWLVQALTDKGQALARETWRPAAPTVWRLAEDQERLVAEQMCRTAVPHDCAQRLEIAFDDPVWSEVARRCLSCGVCAFVCPSCSCFDVQQQGNAWCGSELRCWDACTHALFTRHASGHNPRATREARFRQRTLHKFAYAGPDEEPGLRCVGCGRCTVQCPVGIDIHDAVQRALAAPPRGGADGPS